MEKVSDLSVEELKFVIQSAIKDAMKEILQEVESVKAENLANSIGKAMTEYKIANNHIFDRLKGIYL